MKTLTACIAAILLLLLTQWGYCAETTLNLRHLQDLERRLETPSGKTFRVWAIYAEPDSAAGAEAPYRQVEAPGEGVSCVDDVARVAVFYLRRFQLRRDPASLVRARDALDFVMAMQDPDGNFYNFILSDGSINRTGTTSKLSFDFWAMRGMWALASGYEVFRSLDPPYALVLKKHFDTALKRLKETISHSPHGLPNNATDQGSQALLALCAFYRAEPREDVKTLIEQLADRITSAQGKNPGEFPFRSFPSILPVDRKPPALWHAWGSRQMMALALAGKLLRRPDWIRGAEREANHWIIHLLASRGNLHGMNPGPVLYPEQPYGMEVIVQGLVQLYRSSGKDHYARLAGLAASWFFGNNTAGRTMYDSRTGRVFDGIDEKGVNCNSGAEATISGLLALQEVLEYPQMVSYLPCRETAARRFRIWPARSAPHIPLTQNRNILGVPVRVEENLMYLPYLVFRAGAEERFRIKWDRKTSTLQELKGTQGGSRVLKRLRPVMLSRGEHILEIQFVSGGAKVETLLLQPALEYRVFEKSGRRLALVKNFGDNRARVIFPEGKWRRTRVDIFDDLGKALLHKTCTPTPLDRLELPPFGYCLLEEIS